MTIDKAFRRIEEYRALVMHYDLLLNFTESDEVYDYVVALRNEARTKISYLEELYVNQELEDQDEVMKQYAKEKYYDGR